MHVHWWFTWLTCPAPTGDGGALGALTALATQAAVQSNVQHLGVKKLRHMNWV